MSFQFYSTIRLLILAAILCITGACGNARRERERMAAPDILYQEARKALDGGDFSRATKSYELLQAHFPFSDQGRQARLDLMYAYYKSGDADQAVDAADQFIRENATHPRVDYAYYIKGLAYYEGEPGRIGRLVGVQVDQRPPSDALKSFAAFQMLIQKYPRSEYAHDARLRMISLRNRLAAYEVSVARYYVRRGAYVGAIARAKYAIENYDGAPSIREALALMATSYRALKMDGLAEQTEQVYQTNFPDEPVKAEKKKRWWKFWS